MKQTTENTEEKLFKQHTAEFSVLYYVTSVVKK